LALVSSWCQNKSSNDEQPSWLDKAINHVSILW
jgi:hypothetical protein